MFATSQFANTRDAFDAGVVASSIVDKVSQRVGQMTRLLGNVYLTC